MRQHSNILLAAEEQLVFGHSLPAMKRARNSLKRVIPDCLLLELLEAKIVRAKAANLPAPRPWGA